MELISSKTGLFSFYKPNTDKDLWQFGREKPSENGLLFKIA